VLEYAVGAARGSGKGASGAAKGRRRPPGAGDKKAGGRASGKHAEPVNGHVRAGRAAVKSKPAARKSGRKVGTARR
jgi:hypothetical protein